MNKKLKTIIISAACVLVAGGAILTAVLVSANKVKEVPVYPVTEVGMTEYWGDSLQTSGLVSADKLQSEYITDTQKITSIEVTPGQTVKKGDVLFTYDTTANEIELERKSIEVKKLEVALKQAKDKLEKIKKLRPGVPVSDFISRRGDAKVQRLAAEPDENGLISGNGTPEQPFLYLWKAAKSFSPEFVNSVLSNAGGDSAACIFMVREGDSVSGALLYMYTVTFSRAAAGNAFVITSVSVGSENDPIAPVNPDEPFPFDPWTFKITYTAAEIAKMRQETEQTIRDTSIDLQLMMIEYSKMEKELDTGKVTAELDGTVKTVGTVEECRRGEIPLVTVSAGGGYLIECTLGELELENVTVGQEVTVDSWMTGETLTGNIVSISDMPLSANDGYYYGGNMNVTYYPFTVSVGEEANLHAGDYVGVTYSAAGTEKGVYLMNPFIRTEDGLSFVFIRDENGSIEKREVATGKSVWGSYTQVIGLTAEDMVAFPFGSDVAEGAKAIQGSIEDLYSSMY